MFILLSNVWYNHRSRHFCFTRILIKYGSVKSSYGVYQFSVYKTATLVLKEHRNVNYHVKKVSLCNTMQLPSYIKINSGYYHNRTDGYCTLD